MNVFSSSLKKQSAADKQIEEIKGTDDFKLTISNIY